jgi:hypothetical protein
MSAKSDLPLLDEVTMLLEKERTLLGLKVLEQQLEAEDWKRKYEELIDKVADVANNSENVKVFEVAADVQTRQIRSTDYRMSIMQALRAKHVNWILDLSNIDVGLDGITEILKVFHGFKDSTKITAILLRNSNIDESCNEKIAAVVSFPYFDGFDLSWNHLTRPFFPAMIKALEVSGV